MAASKTYRAITEVHITDVPGKAGDKAKGIAPTPPKVVIIPAKRRFEIDPDSDTCKELLDKGAIELCKDSDREHDPVKVGSAKKAPAKKAPAKKAPAKKDAGEGDGEGNGEGNGEGDGEDML